ncbi:MAG: 16S rRNA (cytosine(1402)-N(4))-methyltransferase RsmH [Deltaproteobacteria bacterium]
MDFTHKPVMLKECIDMLRVNPEGVYVDGTTGGGGHSWEIASLLSEKGTLVCFDRDMDAINASQKKLSVLNKKIIFENRNFSEINQVMNNRIGCLANGILMDLGVSSYQLDNPERGFSYQADALLDMRMDRRQKITAEDVVNNYDKKSLIRIITEYGEEKWAVRIADFICKSREVKRIKTTGELVEIIKKAVPAKARKDGPHPAKRTFQAVRIEVNNELGILEDSIKNAAASLDTGGRICIITFHSLEDRIVKQTFISLEGRCTCPGDFPICRCGKLSHGKIITKKAVEPSEKEIEENPRARSAKLRVFEKY